MALLLTVSIAETLLATSFLFSDGLDEAGRFTWVAASVEVLCDHTELVVVAGRQSFDRAVCKSSKQHHSSGTTTRRHLDTSPTSQTPVFEPSSVDR